MDTVKILYNTSPVNSTYVSMQGIHIYLVTCLITCSPSAHPCHLLACRQPSHLTSAAVSDHCTVERVIDKLINLASHPLQKRSLPSTSPTHTCPIPRTEPTVFHFPPTVLDHMRRICIAKPRPFAIYTSFTSICP